MIRRWLLCLLLMVLTGGCFGETRQYSMSVRNDLSTPISVCLTKTYGPEEDLWESPEQLIQPPRPATDQTPPGIVIPPGKTASRPSFTGVFDPDRGRAFLRVYAGTPDLTQMNAISRGSPDRLDVPLEIGMNRIDIRPGDGGAMTAVRVDGPWPTTQPLFP
jgi:hypothetical protein